MMNLIKYVLAIAAIGFGHSSLAPSRQAWTVSDGARLNPFLQSKGHTAVLIFALTDCPIANEYAPEIIRIVGKYASDKIDFYLVYVDPGITADSAKKHSQDFGYRCPSILDPTHTLAKKAGATVSPEAVVIGEHGAILYRGRIDDRVADYGKVRPTPTRRDLRHALDAVRQGKTPAVRRTDCVGCVISAPVGGRR